MSRDGRQVKGRLLALPDLDHFGDVNEMVLDPMATVETRQTSLAVLYRLLPPLPEQSQSVWGSRYP